MDGKMHIYIEMKSI